MKLLLITVLMVWCSVSAAQDDSKKAVGVYETLLDEKGANPTVLYNLGNAYYRLGEYGQAIYAYERALLLEPRSQDVKTNLGLARKASTAFEADDQSAVVLKIFKWLSYREWLVSIAVVLIILAILSLIHKQSFMLRFPASLRGPVIGLLVFLVIGIVAIIIRYPELSRAIVVNEAAPVRISPFETADTKATLKAGQAVNIESQHDSFYRIKNGWVSKNDVKPLAPR